MVKFYSVQEGESINVPPSDIKYRYTKNGRLQLVGSVKGVGKVYKFARDDGSVQRKYSKLGGSRRRKSIRKSRKSRRKSYSKSRSSRR